VRKDPTHLRLAQQREEFAAGDKVHDHVEIARVGKRAPEVDEERVPDTDEHLALRVGVLDLLHADNLLLAEHLDGVEAAVVARLDEMDAAERAGAEPASQEVDNEAVSEG
jgi:hypothetical protein